MWILENEGEALNREFAVAYYLMQISCIGD
jgi:hypothetical protein